MIKQLLQIQVKEKSQKLSGYSPRYPKIHLVLTKSNQYSILQNVQAKCYFIRTRFHCDSNRYPRGCFSFLEKCSHLHFINSAQGSIQKGWDIIETTRGQQVRQSLEMNPFPTSTLDHRNNVRQSWNKFSRDYSHSFPQGNPTSVSEFTPWQDSATGI